MSGTPAQTLLCVARIAAAFGVRGEVRVLPFERAEVLPGATLLAGHAGKYQPLFLESVRKHKNLLLVRFRGLENADAVDSLHGVSLYVERARIETLPQGTYRHEDLIGLQVSDARLGVLGRVVEVAHYPSNDVLFVGDRRLVVPLLQVYGVRIDLEAKIITTRLPVGFEDL